MFAKKDEDGMERRVIDPENYDEIEAVLKILNESPTGRTKLEIERLCQERLKEMRS